MLAYSRRIYFLFADVCLFVYRCLLVFAACRCVHVCVKVCVFVCVCTLPISDAILKLSDRLGRLTTTVCCILPA